MSGNGVKNKNELSINYNDWKSDINRIMKLKLKGKLKYLKIYFHCNWTHDKLSICFHRDDLDSSVKIRAHQAL